MRSSVDKRRDMARSILPSTSRSAGSHITMAKRANRRRVAQQLAVANGAPADWDDALDGVDPRAYPDHEIRGVVQWRRGCDKLNHFERWAVRVTRDLPPEDRLGALRATLPRGLVGDHAMVHLRVIPELNPDVGYDSWPVRWAKVVAGRTAAAEAAARAAARRRALLVELLELPGAHRALNSAMKAAAVGDPPSWRTLAGRHDVDGFLADVARCAPWQAALERSLGELVAPPR